MCMQDKQGSSKYSNTISSDWLAPLVVGSVPSLRRFFGTKSIPILRGFFGTIYALCWGPQGISCGPPQSQPLGDPSLKRPILRPAPFRLTSGKSVENDLKRHVVSLKGTLFRPAPNKAPDLDPNCDRLSESRAIRPKNKKPQNWLA